MNNVNERHSPFLIFISCNFSGDNIHILLHLPTQFKYVFREGGGEHVTCRDSKLTKPAIMCFCLGGGGGAGGGGRRREKGAKRGKRGLPRVWLYREGGYDRRLGTLTNSLFSKLSHELSTRTWSSPAGLTKPSTSMFQHWGSRENKTRFSLGPVIKCLLSLGQHKLLTSLKIVSGNSSRKVLHEWMAW